MDVPKRVIDFLTELSNPNCYLPVVLGRIARAAEEDARLQELYTQAIAQENLNCESLAGLLRADYRLEEQQNSEEELLGTMWSKLPSTPKPKRRCTYVLETPEKEV